MWRAIDDAASAEPCRAHVQCLGSTLLVVVDSA
jgi:hypothetical protein